MNRLLPLFAALCLSVIAATAQTTKTKIKSIDITVETPVAGMTQQEGEKIKLLSVKTDYGDLVEMGLVTVADVMWQGEFDRTDEEYPKFKPGYTYDCTLSLVLDTGGKYIFNHVVRKDGYIVNNDLLKSSVNGKQSLTMMGAPYFPHVKFYCTIPGEKSQEYLEESHKLFGEERQSYRYSPKAITTDQADADWVGKNEMDVLALNSGNKPKDGFRSIDVKADFLPGQKQVFLTKMIIDVTDGDCRSDEGTSELASLLSLPNLREVWLSDKVDALAFVKALNTNMKSPLFPLAREYRSRSTGFYTARATLCIPESQIASVRELLRKDPTQPVYTVRTYAGDVYSAQKAGLGATHDWCTNHTFSVIIDSADRIMRHGTCQKGKRWYYSCAICGKCERNPNHTAFSRDPKEREPAAFGHDYGLDLATDKAYLGVNAVGYHVYSKSCIWCRQPKSYHDCHITRGEWKESGTEASYEEFSKRMAESNKLLVAQSLMESTPPPQGFFLPLRTTAKTSTSEMQSDANQALNDNLADTTLLGSDYTLPVTREQLCSIAVRLAENLTGKSIGKNDMKGFAEISGAVGTPTRQELAAVIYRTLRYVEQNSNYTYTDYTSRLSSYSDSGEIQEWATEPMAFMEALGLLDPVESGRLAPNQPGTIELALSLAERSTLAHRIGWYQAVNVENQGYFLGVGRSNSNYTNSPSSLACSDRVWITRPELGSTGRLPTVEPYSGQSLFLTERWFNPVRWRGGKVSPRSGSQAAAEDVSSAGASMQKAQKTADKVKEGSEAVKEFQKEVQKAADTVDNVKKGGKAIKNFQKIKKGLGGLMKIL